MRTLWRNRKRILLAQRRRLWTFPPIGFLHAHPDGGPVLHAASSWRTVSGVFVNCRFGHALIQWRRWSDPWTTR